MNGVIHILKYTSGTYDVSFNPVGSEGNPRVRNVQGDVSADSAPRRGVRGYTELVALLNHLSISEYWVKQAEKLNRNDNNNNSLDIPGDFNDDELKNLGPTREI